MGPSPAVHFVPAVASPASQIITMIINPINNNSTGDLVSVFLSIVRPVLEYACSVWHTNLSTYLSDSIELIKKRAMKSIYPGQSYADALQRMGLLTLKERRELLCKLYFNKIKISIFPQTEPSASGDTEYRI